jgi:hypothetical protein
MKYLNNENGWIKPLLSIGILVVIVYSGIQFGIPYYRYSAFKSDATDIARTATATRDMTRVKEDVYAAARSYDIPIGKNDLTVEKSENRIHVQTSWSVKIDIFGVYERTLDFNVDIEE